MHPVQKHLFDTNFKDLAGSKIEGTIAISDELINMGIMDFINGLKSGAESGVVEKPNPAPARIRPDEERNSGPAPDTPDPKALLALLDVETLKFRTEKGKAMLDIKVALKA